MRNIIRWFIFFCGKFADNRLCRLKISHIKTMPEAISHDTQQGQGGVKTKNFGRKAKA